MNPTHDNDAPNEVTEFETRRSDAARTMETLGWYEDGPKLWRSSSGQIRIADIERSFAGNVRVDVSRRIVVLVDRLQLGRLTGLEIAAPHGDLDPSEWAALEYIVGSDLARFIASNREGVLPFRLPPLPLPLQQLALAESLAELIHPIFAVEARRWLDSDVPLAGAAERLAAIATPFIDALFELLEDESLVEEQPGSLTRLRSVLADLHGRVQDGPADETTRAVSSDPQAADLAVIRGLCQLASSTTSSGAGVSGMRAVITSVVPDYDLVEVDHALGATVALTDDALVVSVDTGGVTEPIFASTVNESGRLDTVEVSFESEALIGTARLAHVEGEFWIEVHGAEEPDSERWERAANFAETGAARLVAVVQAIAAGRDATGDVGATAAELRAFADVFEDVAFDLERAEQARRVAEQLEHGVTPFGQLGSVLTSELLTRAQPVLHDFLHLKVAQRTSHRDDLLRSLLAERSERLTAEEIPDFVPIDWIVEEFRRSLPETPFPDRALARSMNSADDTSHRVELDDEQLDATGISSIVIEFSEQTVTVTVTRDRSRANYALRIIEAGEALPVERSENPIADVYIAEFHRAASAVRVELDLGTRK